MSRKQANANYIAAVANRRAFENSSFGMSEAEHKAAYMQACKLESEACAALVVAEIAFPTAAEQSRAQKKLMLRNRGFDL